MAPHGNGPTAPSAGINQKFFVLSEDDHSLKNMMDTLKKERMMNRRDKMCVVGVIGKSPFEASNCKAALIDQTIGRNVFEQMFCQTPTVDSHGCQIEGFCDTRNNTIYLQLNSVLDSQILQEICKRLDRDLVEKGFLQVWPEMQMNLVKSLLLLFHISHIIVVIHPRLQFDLNYLSLFRILDSTRQKLQPIITDGLKHFPSLPSDWILAARLCSPRALFVFENYDNDFVKKEDVNDLERQLEDQIYRILRKSRIITNISGNSLFALPLHADFVFISTKNPTIRNSSDYLLKQLIKHCNVDDKTTTKSDDTTSWDCEEDSDMFNSFLRSHIQTCLTKGFDDNIGRHVAPPIFELPTIKEFFEVILKLKQILFADDKSDDDKSYVNFLRNSLDMDVRFSESRCAKVLPSALGHYKEALPSHYTREFHEIKMAQAIQQFTALARGPAVYDYAQQLRNECENYWLNGHQMCEVLSLTGNHCIKPVHRVKSDDGDGGHSDDGYSDESEGLPVMRHCSGVKLISACDCGRKQGNREDPFSVKAANHDFYMMMRNKCVCGHLDRMMFPVFEPAGDDDGAPIAVRLGPKSPKSGASAGAGGAGNAQGNNNAQGVGANSLFDASLSSGEMRFESQPDVASSFTNLSQQVSADLNTDVLISDFGTKANLMMKEDEATATEPQTAVAIASSSTALPPPPGPSKDNDGSVGESNADDKQRELDGRELAKDGGDEDDDNKNNSEGDNDEEDDEDDDDDDDYEEEEDGSQANWNEQVQANLRLIIRNANSSFEDWMHRQSSTTQYLPGMLHMASPPGLLPKFGSWSLVCVGPSSIYSHNIGLQDQAGFIAGSNFLLPWDVTVKLEHSGHLPPLWEGKRPPGIKNKKTFKDGTQFTVKIFIGVEYECPRGHRFICSGPDSVLKTNVGSVKESANRMATSDMPLYFPCVCSRTGKSCLSQLQRIHVVTPKAPVYVTLNPRVQPAPMPCPVFYPGNSEPIKLSQSAYWILRLPFIYDGAADGGPFPPPKDQLPVESSRLLKGTFGIAEFIGKP